VVEVFEFRADRGGTPFDPPPRYELLRDEDPVSQVSMWDGSKVWLVTRYADVRAVLGDERFSADNRNPGFPLFTPQSEPLTKDNPAFVRMDNPEHDRLRAMVAAEFTRKRAVELRPRIQQIVDRFADGMLAHSPPADLVAEFALPIPSAVICMILGVPYENHGVFERCTAVMMAGEAGSDAASEELTRFLAEVVESKARQPADDLISRLVGEQEKRGELTRDDTISMARALLMPGYETTSMQIGLSVTALLYHPAQLAALRDDPALIPGAVDELLRYLTVTHSGMPRVAVTDAEIGGQHIRAGEGVVCYLPAANRDRELFEAPEVLDVTRKSRGHLAFGYGPHRCIGQWLAKAESEVALETLIRRFPALRLATDFDQLPFRQEMFTYGVFELPVTW
jgi:cytochrome P450